MLSLEEILSDLEQKSKKSREELLAKIKKKQEELSGLVSSEGAAHLVARDLGVSIIRETKRELKLKDIKPDMKNIETKVRIIGITDTRKFKRKDGKEGRVASLIVTDGTAEARIPLWDKQVELIDEKTVEKNDIIEIKNAYAKENIFGGLELRLSKYSRIEKVEDDKSIPYRVIKPEFERKKLKDIREGSYEIRGNIVNVFNINPLFKTCPKCNSKLEKDNKGYKCSEHGYVEPVNNLIISTIIDDGTSTIRAVFFRDAAEKLSNINPNTLSNMTQEESIDLIRENILGNDVLLTGVVRKNKIFDSLEFIVRDVKEFDIEYESKTLIDEISSFR